MNDIETIYYKDTILLIINFLSHKLPPISTPVLPLAYVERMRRLLGGEFGAYMDTFQSEASRALHINTRVISPEDFISRSGIPTAAIPYCRNGYLYDVQRIGRHPYHHAGAIYVQEPSAMLPISAVNIQADWKILDMCAAPGGKSSQIASQLGGDGVLVANDVSRGRCRILTGNIERMGYGNVIITSMAAGDLAEFYGEAFDLTLVDAPCSGEGMFRKDNAAIREWSPAGVMACAARQAAILEHAGKTVRGGGYLLYATCTFSVEENEENILAFISKNKRFELVECGKNIIDTTCPGIEIKNNIGVDLTRCRRAYPFASPGEGQFFALMRNASCTPGTAHYKRAASDSTNSLIVNDFLSEAMADIDFSRIIKRGKYYSYFENSFPAPPSAISLGVTLGESDGARFKPHHQLFSALGRQFKRQIDLSLADSRLAEYLRGGVFQCGLPDGWAAILADTIPVGGVKVVGGVAKNYYPKGLRNTL